MKKIYSTLTSLIILISLLSLKNLQAQNSGLRYFLLKPSAKSMALGGSGASYYGNDFSVFYNPALISESPGMSFSGSYVTPLPFFDAIEHFYLGSSLKMKDDNFLSLTANFFKQPAQQATDNEGNEQGGDGSGNDNYHYMIKAAYAFNFMDDISFGLAIGYYDILLSKGHVGGENAKGETSGFTFDAGIYIKNILPEATIIIPDMEIPSIVSEWASADPIKGIQAGLSLSNYGQDVFFVDKAQEDPLPTFFLLGISYRPLYSNYLSAMLTAEIENQVYEDPFTDIIRTGIEINLIRVLDLRAGYVKGNVKSRKSFPTFGFGLDTKILEINISRYNSTFLPTWHYDISYRMEF